MKSQLTGPRVIAALVLSLLGTVCILLGLGAFYQEDPIASPLLAVGVLALVGFTVLLTIARQRAITPVGQPRPEGKLKVVAIDDEADILRLVRIKLTREGFAVSTASNGDEGINRVLAERPDIMIVDVLMPGKDGYQVVSEVKRRLGSSAPIAIMLTSKAEEADMKRGLAAGADDYITKPFSPRELIERINVALLKSDRNAA